MLILVGASLIHWAIPDYRWVLIHMFTLGIVTNSIVLWSQHFTEKFLHQPLTENQRPWQLRRIWILNAGIVITLIGQLLKETFAQHWHITAVGAGIVGAVLVTHSVLLLRQYRKAKKGQRYAASVIGYVCATSYVAIGAVLGAAMAAQLPTPWQEQLRLAHLVVNILGFVGITAIASLMLLFPAVWRTQAGKEQPRTVFTLLVLGTAIAASGAGAGHTLATVAGLGIYLAGLGVSLWGFSRCVVKVLGDPRDRLGFAALSVAFAPLWLAGSLVALIIRCLQADSIAAVSLPTMAVLIGFAAQLLIGVMSYLLPSTIGGGPQATRTGLAVMDRAGMLRSTFLNIGLPMWLYTENSWLRIILSLLVFGSLAVFLILSPLAAKAQLGVIRKKREPLSLAEKPKSNQMAIGMAMLALIVACFGGLGNHPQVATTTDSNAATTHIQLEIQGMTFSPDVLDVPAGNQLVVSVTNNDTMAHDLKFDNGAQTGRINPGETAELVVGVVESPMQGWCTIAGHRAQGMELEVITSSGGTAPSSSAAAPSMNQDIDNGIDPSLEAVTTR